MTPEIINFLAVSSWNTNTVIVIACRHEQERSQWWTKLDTAGALLKTPGDDLGCQGVWLRFEKPENLCAFHADNIIRVFRTDMPTDCWMPLRCLHGRGFTVEIMLAPETMS